MNFILTDPKDFNPNKPAVLHPLISKTTPTQIGLAEQVSIDNTTHPYLQNALNNLQILNNIPNQSLQSSLDMFEPLIKNSKPDLLLNQPYNQSTQYNPFSQFNPFAQQQTIPLMQQNPYPGNLGFDIFDEYSSGSELQQKKKHNYLHYLFLDKWLLDDYSKLLKYLVYDKADDMIRLLRDDTKIAENDIKKDTPEIIDKKVSFIEGNIFTKQKSKELILRVLHEERIPVNLLPLYIKNSHEFMHKIKHTFGHYVKNMLKHMI